MKIINSIQQISESAPLVITLGNFDGVHLGHVNLLTQVKKHAAAIKGKVVVMTFVPHPMLILNKINEKFLLTTAEKKRQLLDRDEVDYLVEVNFTRDVSTLSPLDFLQNYVLASKNVSAMFLGFNFSFGAKKSGTHQVVKELLAKHAPKVELHIAKAYEFDGAAVSSSRIRGLLEQGDVESAKNLLGRHHAISGVVVKGDGRGTTIGFPTANIKIPSEFLYPKPAVYITKTKYKDLSFYSLTNIGVKPTFSQPSQLNFETHILDFHQMIYGEEIEVEFFSKIRDEKKFASVNQLIEQIKNDQEFAIKYWKKHS